VHDLPGTPTRATIDGRFGQLRNVGLPGARSRRDYQGLGISGIGSYTPKIVVGKSVIWAKPGFSPVVALHKTIAWREETVTCLRIQPIGRERVFLAPIYDELPGIAKMEDGPTDYPNKRYTEEP
jgi:hypothetical protein